MDGIRDLIFSELDVRGISQEEFASALHVSKQVVSNWKKGLNSGYMKYINEIATFFGVSTSYIYSAARTPSPERLAAHDRNASADNRDVYEELFKTFSRSEVEMLSRLSRDQAARLVKDVEKELGE